MKAEHLRYRFNLLFDRHLWPDEGGAVMATDLRLSELRSMVGDIVIWIEDFEKQQEEQKGEINK